MVFLERFPELGVDVRVVFLVFPEFFSLGVVAGWRGLLWCLKNLVILVCFL